MEKYIVPCSKKISKLCHETVEHTIPNRIGTCFECKNKMMREYYKIWIENNKKCTGLNEDKSILAI